VRHRPHRHLVRLPARGHSPGRGDAGQGARRRRADRRLPDGGQGEGLFKPGNHGSTFGGNQLASTAALTTIAVIEKDGLIANAVAVGQLIREGLAQALAGIAKAWSTSAARG
jgi:glutamate-1-semialdehyde aminotransferase